MMWGRHPICPYIPLSHCFLLPFPGFFHKLFPFPASFIPSQPPTNLPSSAPHLQFSLLPYDWQPLPGTKSGRPAQWPVTRESCADSEFPGVTAEPVPDKFSFTRAHDCGVGAPFQGHFSLLDHACSQQLKKKKTDSFISKLWLFSPVLSILWWLVCNT